MTPRQTTPPLIGTEKTTIAYRRINGHEILADIYRSKSNRACPVIVYIHGGARIVGNREMDASEDEYIEAPLLTLAKEKDYAVVSIDDRLAPETKLPAIASDIEAAFFWLRGEGAKLFHLDLERMIVVGFSAGGYLALLAGYRVNPKPRALLAVCAYGELNADWYAKPNPYPMYRAQMVSREEALQQTDGTVISDGTHRRGDGWKIYMHYRQNGLWPQEVSGFSPESLAREIAPYEPVRNITREYPPTLLIHGTHDTDAPIEEPEKLSAQFNRCSVPHIFRSIDKGEHGLIGGDPEQIKEAYNTMHEFILRYLEPK